MAAMYCAARFAAAYTFVATDPLVTSNVMRARQGT